MNKELIVKWVDALESEKYSQTRKKLRGKDGHCCLGVLIEVIDPEAQWVWKELTMRYHYPVRDGYCSCVPPKSFWEKLDIPEEVSDYQQMNDGAHDGTAPPMSFEEIAQHLREKYL